MTKKHKRNGQLMGFLQGSEASPTRQQRLYLSDEDRSRGLHIIGAPGSGKSKLLEQMIRQDILAGNGVCLIDPHGELYENLLEWCAYVRPPAEIIPVNLSRGQHVIGFNPFRAGPGDIFAQVDRRIDATVKAWGASNSDDSPRLERWLKCIFYVIMANPDLSLCEAASLITYRLAHIRDYLTHDVEDETVRGNWQDLATVKNVEQFNNQLESARNRLTRFLTGRSSRRFMALTDSTSNLDLGACMDRGAVILVNLKRSEQLSRMNARLFGALLVNEFVDAVQHREVGGGRTPRPFYLYLDEFQNFVTRDIGEAVTQVRKFGLRFVLAHQLLKQLRDDEVDILDEVMTAVRARAVFGGLNAKDAADLVGDVFPGVINYTEVKYMDQSVKFWPVYSRDKVYSKTRGGGRGHTDASGTMSASGASSSSMQSFGFTTPDTLPVYGFAGGSRFDSSGWGSVDSWSSGDSHTSADTTSESWADSEADIPIFYPVPFIEETPRFFEMAEQKQRLADKLMLQLMRHCFLKPPESPAVPLLVPFVKRWPLPEELVREYEAEMAANAGALSPAAVDAILADRRSLIEHQAREFVTRAEKPVQFPVEHDHEPQPIKLKSGRARKKPAAKGSDGSQG